jgi:hypothetical protein
VDRDRLKALAVLEGIALGIALAAPVTPSRTGSTWSPAEMFTPDPNYLQKVLAGFVVVNLMIAVIGVAVWLLDRRSGSR